MEVLPQLAELLEADLNSYLFSLFVGDVLNAFHTHTSFSPPSDAFIIADLAVSMRLRKGREYMGVIADAKTIVDQAVTHPTPRAGRLH